MSARSELTGWSRFLVRLVIFVSLEGLVTAFNSSLPNSTSIVSSTILSSSSSINIHPNATINTPSTSTALVTSSSVIIAPSPTHDVPASVSPNSTSPTNKPNPQQPTNKLSSFGIVMLSIGGILIVVLVVCLMVICCHGRERGPERPHVPHSNVKMKPWKSAELSTSKDLTEDTIDALDQPNHTQSHHNSGLTNSPRSSPSLPGPSSNNNSISTPTGTFKNLQAHTAGGDLGAFGRKLSLGRQAYEQNDATPDESTAEHKPTKEPAKGEQDDMTIHFV